MHAIIMKDKGLDMGLVESFDTSKESTKGNKWGFRKMFWTYLKKMGVAFKDPCCSDASEEDTYPVRYNEATGKIEFWNGTIWANVPDSPLNPTTTTTTTTI